MELISFELEPIPTFRLDLTVWARRRRPHNEVGLWDGHSFHLVLFLCGMPVAVTVTQIAAPETPRLRATVAGAQATPNMEAAVADALRPLLGLDIDLSAFHEFAAA